MLRGLREHVPSATLLVIDDNSPDGTASKVEAFAKQDVATQLIVRNERGLGGAIKRALRFAIDHDFDWLVNLDGDLSHDPAQVPRLLETALNSSRPSNLAANDSVQQEQIHPDPVQPDVIVGSRYMPGGEIVGWPLRRRLMSRIVNRFATACLRLPVSDCSGSMRCYRVRSLKQIDTTKLTSNGYALLEELLVAIQRSGATLAEVPITFTDRTQGNSKLTPREALRSASEIIRLAFRK